MESIFKRISYLFKYKHFHQSSFLTHRLTEKWRRVVMFYNTPTTSEKTDKPSTHIPDRSANRMVAIPTHPLPRVTVVKGLLFFLSQNSSVLRQKKIKETTIYKFKSTAVKFRKLGELLRPSVFTLGFFHDWSLTLYFLAILFMSLPITEIGMQVTYLPL